MDSAILNTLCIAQCQDKEAVKETKQVA